MSPPAKWRIDQNIPLLEHILIKKRSGFERLLVLLIYRGATATYSEDESDNERHFRQLVSLGRALRTLTLRDRSVVCQTTNDASVEATPFVLYRNRLTHFLTRRNYRRTAEESCDCPICLRTRQTRERRFNVVR